VCVCVCVCVLQVHDDVVNLLSGTLQPTMKRIVPKTQMVRLVDGVEGDVVLVRLSYEL